MFDAAPEAVSGDGQRMKVVDVEFHVRFHFESESLPFVAAYSEFINRLFVHPGIHKFEHVAH